MTEKFRTVSADGRAALAVVTFTETRQEMSTGSKDALQRTVPDADPDGVRADSSLEIAQDLSQLPGPAEVVGVAVAAMVPLVMLGTVVAAGLTAITALAALDLTGIPFLGVMGTEGAISVAAAVLIVPPGPAAHVPPDRETEPEQAPERQAAGTPAQ